MPLLWSRAVGCLVVLSASHLILRKFEPASDQTPVSFRQPTLAAGVLFAFMALALLPTFDATSFPGGSFGSVLGVLAVFWIARSCYPGFTDAQFEAQRWLTVWALAVAAPLTVFAQSDFSGVAASQDALIAQLLPAWGVFFQPFAFVFALVGLVQWSRLSDARTISVRAPQGLMLGILLIVTVTVFLGAWHVPWAANSSVRMFLGDRNTGVALFQIVIFLLKVSGLWAAILLLDRKPEVWSRMNSFDRLWLLAAANLVLTWIVLAVIE